MDLGWGSMKWEEILYLGPIAYSFSFEKHNLDTERDHLRYVSVFLPFWLLFAQLTFLVDSHEDLDIRKFIPFSFIAVKQINL